MPPGSAQKAQPTPAGFQSRLRCYICARGACATWSTRRGSRDPAVDGAPHLNLASRCAMDDEANSVQVLRCRVPVRHRTCPTEAGSVEGCHNLVIWTPSAETLFLNAATDLSARATNR